MCCVTELWIIWFVCYFILQTSFYLLLYVNIIYPGPGSLFILELTPDNKLVLNTRMQWTDGLFDVVFAEDHPDVLVTASGDCGLQLWDLKAPQVYLSLQLS